MAHYGPARVRVSISEVRSIGAVPIAVKTAHGPKFLTVPRGIVKVTSIIKGISGKVLCEVKHPVGNLLYKIEVHNAWGRKETLIVPKELVSP